MVGNMVVHSLIATLPYSHMAYIATEPHSCIATKGCGLWPLPQSEGGLRPPPLCGTLRGYAAMWLCSSVAMWLCSYVAVWLWGYVAMWLCGHVATWRCGSVLN